MTRCCIKTDSDGDRRPAGPHRDHLRLARSGHEEYGPNYNDSHDTTLVRWEEDSNVGSLVCDDASRVIEVFYDKHRAVAHHHRYGGNANRFAVTVQPRGSATATITNARGQVVSGGPTTATPHRHLRTRTSYTPAGQLRR